MDLRHFEKTRFTAQEVTRIVYRRGQGPGVVILHELPGITPEVIRLADLVADAGFRVVLPVLFGIPGKPLSTGYLISQFVRVCISREFRILATRSSSPITDWLRALCQAVHLECGGPGVGVIGMCLTGGFALSLFADETVLAPVTSQPSLPLAILPGRSAALGISDDELAMIRRRADQGQQVLGLRFTNDRLCPAQRFETLHRELGSGFESIQIDSSLGNSHGIRSNAHSVLTLDFVDEDGHPTRAALDRVLAMFRERLAPRFASPR
jgi:dienelactone hydrolase